ncbi:MAG: ribonuclease R, partial [Primorskyibacter sp.]
MSQTPPQIPTRAQILDWIAAHPTQTSKRDIAKAFGIKGADRIALKRILRALTDEGHLEQRSKSLRDPDRLPPVGVLRVGAPDADGDLFAQPLEWRGEGPEPRVLMVVQSSDPALGEGDRVLARLQQVEDEDHDYAARLIRRIGTAPRRILGIFRTSSEGGRIVPIDKGASAEWLVPGDAAHGARDGELVEGEQSGPRGRLGLPRARIVHRLGDPSGPKAVSLIAIHQHGIPD